MIDTIASVHLITGEDIIGTVTVSHNGGRCTIEKPVIPNVGMDPQAQRFTVGLLPLRPYFGNLDSITIDGAHVVYVAELPESMQKMYRQFTSTIHIAEPADIAAVTGPERRLIKG